MNATGKLTVTKMSATPQIQTQNSNVLTAITVLLGRLQFKQQAVEKHKLSCVEPVKIFDAGGKNIAPWEQIHLPHRAEGLYAMLSVKCRKLPSFWNRRTTTTCPLENARTVLQPDMKIAPAGNAPMLPSAR